MAYIIRTRLGNMDLDKAKPSGAYWGFRIFSVFGLVFGTAFILAVPPLLLKLLGLPYLGIGILCTSRAKKYATLWWQEKERYEKEKARQERITFYEECQKHNIKNIHSQASQKKAKLLAENLDIEVDDIVSFYNEACQAVEEQRIAELKESEEEAYDILTRYTEYTGYDKRVAMMEDLIEVKQNELYTLTNPAVKAEMSKQKEIDWAIHGGIASGIAGPAAGLAIALDISQKNMAIREQNAELQRLQTLYLSTVANEISKLNRQIQALERQIDTITTKVIAETPPAEIMDNLSITQQSATISETGAFLVKATVKCKKPVMIYNELPGVIDGTIAADFYQGQKLIGTALMALPMYGITDKKDMVVEGFCLEGADPSKAYQLQFRPYNLWEIEQ